MSAEAPAYNPETEPKFEEIEQLREAILAIPKDHNIMFDISSEKNSAGETIAGITDQDKRHIQDHFGWQDGEPLELNVDEHVLLIARSKVEVLSSHDPSILKLWIENIVDTGTKRAKRRGYSSGTAHFRYSEQGNVWSIDPVQAEGIRVAAIPAPVSR